MLRSVRALSLECIYHLQLGTLTVACQFNCLGKERSSGNPAGLKRLSKGFKRFLFDGILNRIHVLSLVDYKKVLVEKFASAIRIWMLSLGQSRRRNVVRWWLDDGSGCWCVLTTSSHHWRHHIASILDLRIPQIDLPWSTLSDGLFGSINLNPLTVTSQGLTISLTVQENFS